jgi:hypothetical protein
VSLCKGLISLQSKVRNFFLYTCHFERVSMFFLDLSKSSCGLEEILLNSSGLCCEIAKWPIGVGSNMNKIK